MIGTHPFYAQGIGSTLIDPLVLVVPVDFFICWILYPFGSVLLYIPSLTGLYLVDR